MAQVAVVVPVYGNAATLAPLAERLAAALHGHDWRLRLVIDASPDDSAAVAARLTGLPPDAGAFLAMGSSVRAAVVAAVSDGGAPSVVLAVGRAGEPMISVPVARDRRPVGESAWTAGTRLRQSLRSLAWAARSR
jgi:glycosyltransferase involved in cell wall biosynthesis